jgi:hypothetical protein
VCSWLLFRGDASLRAMPFRGIAVPTGACVMNCAFGTLHYLAVRCNCGLAVPLPDPLQRQLVIGTSSLYLGSTNWAVVYCHAMLWIWTDSRHCQPRVCGWPGRALVLLCLTGCSCLVSYSCLASPAVPPTLSPGCFKADLSEAVCKMCPVSPSVSTGRQVLQPQLAGLGTPNLLWGCVRGFCCHSTAPPC